MPADTARLEALAQNRTLRQQKDAARKEAARRAWEGGECTIQEIAQSVHADDRTVKRWAKEGMWKGGPCGREAIPLTASETRHDALHVGHRGRGAFQRDDGTD